MGTKLTSLTSQAMALGANSGVGSYINDWANWSIKEIWEDRLWPFRVREMTPFTLGIGLYQVTLPTDWDLLKELRVLTTGYERKLRKKSAQILREQVPEYPDLANPATPECWIDPIVELGSVGGTTTKLVEVYPVADQSYSIGGSYYAEHPALGSNDYCLIPSRYDYVIIDRLIVYVKTSEDEIDVTPWIRKYENSLKKMRAAVMRSMDEQPRFRHERELAYALPSLIRNDTDIFRG